MLQRGLQVRVAEHAGDFPDSGLTGDTLDVTGRHPAPRAFRDDDVVVGPSGDLRQVRDDQHLTPTGYCPQRLSHLPAHFAADPLIHLVENERRNRIVAGQDDLQREHETGGLTAGGDTGEWTGSHSRRELDFKGDALSAKGVGRGEWDQP
jgi:hypothetical protein